MSADSFSLYFNEQLDLLMETSHTLVEELEQARKDQIAMKKELEQRRRDWISSEKRQKEWEKTENSLVKIVKELESFDYSVAHELLAPLRAIDTFSGALLEEHREKLDDEGRRYLNLIKKNARNMRELVDNLLAFSCLGQGTLEKGEIDMTELAREVFEEIKASLPDRNIEFDLQPLPPAYGVRIMFRQVFTNLLSNAIKFSRTRDIARIEMGARIENDQVIYHVKDNGVGFDMKHVDNLFKAFQRLHSPSDFEGSGVGLANVKQIIDRHAGRIWAESEVNKGAIFYFSLPELKLAAVHAV